MRTRPTMNTTDKLIFGGVLAVIVGAIVVLAVWLYPSPRPPCCDTEAGSTLSNALREADAFYQSGSQSFSASVTKAFTSSVPWLGWTSGSCGVSASNCVSYHVYDANKHGDAQVLVLANPEVDGCRYNVEVEQTPTLPTITGDGAHQLDIEQAGVWYAKSDQAVCSATTPVAQSFHHWFTTYSSVNGSE